MDKNELEFYESYYFQNGYDVPFELSKGRILSIKPILVKDYTIYDSASQILDIKKNESSNVEDIQMSYLEFILSKILDGNENFKNQLCCICELCFGENNIKIGTENSKKVLLFCDKNDNVKKIINKKEFDTIRKIILYQNDTEYDDRYVSPDIRKVVESYYAIKYRNTEIPSLERRKSFVISKTGIELNKINDMSYRLFSLVYDACIDSEIYIGEKIIQGSPKYDVKEEIQHPLHTKKKDKYEQAFVDEDVFKGKLESVT